MDSDTRFDNLVLRLRRYTDRWAIICLQEVSRDWYTKLCVFFAEVGYLCHFTGYGTDWDGYMGVLIAWPIREFILVEAVTSRIGDTLTDGDVPPDLRTPRPAAGLVKSLISRMASLYKWITTGRAPAKNKSVIDDAKGRDNCATFVRLQPAYKRTDIPACFWVGVYHMPCVYGSREKEAVAWAHIHGIRRLCERLMRVRESDGRRIPLILAGDFNMTPSSSAYGLLREVNNVSGLTMKRCAFALVSLNDVSAYASVKGAEPQFTTRAWPKHIPDEFCETLDYIFLSGYIRATSVDDLPMNKTELLPCRGEPSDHLPVMATIKNI